MSTRFEFCLSSEDTDRLFSIKAARGKDSLSGNAFAKEILENQLYFLHPKTPKFDENGNEI